MTFKNGNGMQMKCYEYTFFYTHNNYKGMHFDEKSIYAREMFMLSIITIIQGEKNVFEYRINL